VGQPRFKIRYSTSFSISYLKPELLIVEAREGNLFLVLLALVELECHWLPCY